MVINRFALESVTVDSPPISGAISLPAFVTFQSSTTGNLTMLNRAVTMLLQQAGN